MKILHYMPGLPPVRDGGLVRYAIDLMKQEMLMGEKIMLLIPGALSWNGKNQVKIKRYRGNARGLPSYVIVHPLPISMGNGISDIPAYTKACDHRVYADFLRRTMPDIIHIHTFMGLHREFLEEAKKLKIPVVFTTHDYFGICPKADLMLADAACTDNMWKQCGACCKHAYSKKRLRIEQSVWYRFYRNQKWMVSIVHKGIMKTMFQALRAPKTEQVPYKGAAGSMDLQDYSGLRAYYQGMFEQVTCFHFNSTTAKKVYRSWLGEIHGCVIGISHLGIRDHRKKRRAGKKLRLGYFGGWLEHKGFFRLLDVCGRMYEQGYRELELHVYADTEKREEAFVVSHKRYDVQKMQHVFDQIDLLVVPSIWQETFGFVVLEALSYGVPVVISENVGAKDILIRNPGCGILYDGTAKGLKCALVQIYKQRWQLQQMNERILNMGDEFSYETHVKKMLGLYRRLLPRV